MMMGLSRNTVVQAIQGSREYNQRVVTQLYQRYLHRTPDAGGLTSFTNTLMNGVSELTIRQIILGSAEYWSIHGSTAAGFVQALYNDVVGRSYNGTEASYWITLAKSGNRAAVLGGLTGSWEANSVIVGNLYQTLLHRSPDPAGLAGWVNFLQATGNWSYVINLFGASIEFYNDSLVF